METNNKGLTRERVLKEIEQAVKKYGIWGTGLNGNNTLCFSFNEPKVKGANNTELQYVIISGDDDEQNDKNLELRDLAFRFYNEKEEELEYVEADELSTDKLIEIDNEINAAIESGEYEQENIDVDIRDWYKYAKYYGRKCDNKSLWAYENKLTKTFLNVGNNSRYRDIALWYMQKCKEEGTTFVKDHYTMYPAPYAKIIGIEKYMTSEEIMLHFINDFDKY